MKITYNTDTKEFIAISSYSEKDTLKAAGFRWSPDNRCWYTKEARVALRLAQYATDDVKKALSVIAEQTVDAIEESRAVSADIVVPAPAGLAYRDFQLAGIKYAMSRPATLVGDEPGLGKEQPLTSQILTPGGWIKMGDIKVGDTLVAVNGDTQKVVGVYPQGKKMAYRVHFTDGSWADCGRDHLWLTQDGNMVQRKTGWKTRTVGEMLERGVLFASGSCKWKIPIIKPSDMQETPLLIDPYILGVLIGDGYLRGTTVTFSSPECKSEVYDEVAARLPKIQRMYRSKERLPVNIAGTINRKNPMLESIRAYGLNVLSRDRFIPQDVFTASYQDRLLLLQGLMDTDGSCRRHRCMFHTVSGVLQRDVCALVRSLGGVAISHPYDRTKDGKGIEYQVLVHLPVCPFILKRKVAQWAPPRDNLGKYIRKIEELGVVEQQCIAVSSPDHLYITDNYIVTHNTIVSAGVINADPTIKRVLVVAPASLKINWLRELTKWLVRPTTIEILNGKPSTYSADILIMNYDILTKHPTIKSIQWDLLVCDESHYLKNPKTIRSTQVFGRVNKKEPEKAVSPIMARRKLFLTGTPILNRPIELWTIAKALDPQGLGRNWINYVTRYCNGHRGRYGWEVDGASNLGELQERLRGSFMIRRLKSEVLKELPQKTRQIIELQDCSSAVAAESRVLAQREVEAEQLQAAVELAKAGSDGEYDAAVNKLRDFTQAGFTEMAALRHQTALAKIPQVVEHVTDLLENEGKVILFAHHHDVIDQLAAAFPGISVTLTGQHSQEHRQNAVDRFQTDPAIRLFIGSIQAAGVGLTLTASSTVVFAELDWVPGNMMQAEDRAHRIGQRDNVLIQHLVIDGSMDATLAKTLVAKQQVIDAALDNQAAPVEPIAEAVMPDPVMPTVEAATASSTKQQIAEDAATLTAEQIEEIHQALRYLAGTCDGARAIDDRGFNKMDSQIGHKLASCPQLTAKQAALGKRILKKYHRQIKLELV